MAAVKIRYGRLFCILRLCYKPECFIPQGIAVRGLCGTIISKLYYKTPLLSGKNWNGIRTTHDVFLKPRSFGQVDLRTRSRSKDVHSRRGEEDSEYDSESEDENILVGKSNKRKQKSDQAAKFRKSKLRQKSTKTMTLRPSKYLFRDRKDWNEEKQWEGREIPEDLKSKASWYSRQMAKLASEGEIEKVLELFSSFKEEKIPLTVEIFNIIISAYARGGRIRKAFKFYNDVKKRGLKPTPRTYTSLFNACSKSAAPSQSSLEHVEKLLAEINTRISEKDFEMNVITYNAAIQAVTVCGDPLRAFEIYDEMKYNNIKPDGHTFSSLLTACSFDNVNGPSTALNLIEEMKALKIKPDIYIFNSVLKVMRDFKVFNQDQSAEATQSRQIIGNAEMPKVQCKGAQGNSKYMRNKEVPGDEVTNQGTSYNPQGNNISNVKQVVDDLNLHNHFPGVEQFIQMMAVEDVYPDVRTFQLLLYLITSKAEEEYLLELMKSCNVSPDVTFFNTLVKRSVLEGNLQKAKEHMKRLEETLNVSPSEKSYQTLARGCTNQQERIALLDEIQSEGITPAQSVYGTLIAGAAKQRQFSSLIQLVKRMTRDGVKPNERMMETLERAYMLPCRRPILKGDTNRRLAKEKRFHHVEQKGFQTFFENWKEKIMKTEATSKERRHLFDCEKHAELNDDASDDEDSRFSHL